jgi:hypothetical protein
MKSISRLSSDPHHPEVPIIQQWNTPPPLSLTRLKNAPSNAGQTHVPGPARFHPHLPSSPYPCRIHASKRAAGWKPLV